MQYKVILTMNACIILNSTLRTIFAYMKNGKILDYL